MIGWKSPTRHVNSERLPTDCRDSVRGKVIGESPSIGQSYKTWNPTKTIGAATECIRIALTMFFCAVKVPT